MTTSLIYTLVTSGELGPMLTSWLPYLEKKVTQARGDWTMTATTLKMDSKKSHFLLLLTSTAV